MSSDPELEKLPIDPPDNQGGGNLVAPTGSESDTVLEPAAAPIDPPDNQGGG